MSISQDLIDEQQFENQHEDDLITLFETYSYAIGRELSAPVLDSIVLAAFRRGYEKARDNCDV